MNTPPEAGMSLGVPASFHTPGSTFDLPGQHLQWKETNDPASSALHPNGRYQDEANVKDEEEEEERGSRDEEEEDIGGEDGDYHDPRSTFDLTGQQSPWKEMNDPNSSVLQSNGLYQDDGDVKEEEAETDRRRDNEDISEDGEHDEDEEREEEDRDNDDDSVDDIEETQPDRDANYRRYVATAESPYGQTEQSKTNRNRGTTNRAHERIEKTEGHSEGHDEVEDAQERVREEVEEDDEEEEEEEEDDEEEDEEGEGDDEDDRIKETQKLVAKIEHDIQGLRFQAKQRGHLLSDLHRYGSQNPRKHEQTPSHETPNQRATPQVVGSEPPSGQGEAGKIIERPVSGIKLRLRTRSTSPKAQQERYAPPSVTRTKPAAVKMRPLRIWCKQLARWDAWKETLAVKADRELAKIMLDHMDRTYFQQFLPPSKSPKSPKGQKRKKKEKKQGRKLAKPKKMKMTQPANEWADGYFDEELDDLFDDPIVEEKDDYDYDPSFDTKAHKSQNPVRNKRKSQRPRKLMGVGTSPRPSRSPKTPRAPRPAKRAPKVSGVEEEGQNHPPSEGEAAPVAVPVVVKKKRGRKPKPKPLVEIKEGPKKSKAPKIHRGGRRPSVMSKLRNLDWNALPRRYECKICCQRYDGIVAFRSHLETTHPSEYLKDPPPPHKDREEEGGVEGGVAGTRAGEKPYSDADKHYQELAHLHGGMQDSEQRRIAEAEMYRSMTYGQDAMDSRRYEMMPPFKRHLHDSYSNDWGKMQGNMYSRPLVSGQGVPGEQTWGHNRGFEAVPSYRKHYEDGRDWGKSSGQYPNVIASLGLNMQMGMEGGGGAGHRPHMDQQGEDYSMHGGNMMNLEGGSSHDNTFTDMGVSHGGENTEGGEKDVLHDGKEADPREEGGEPPTEKEASSNNDGAEAGNDASNQEEGDGEEEEEEEEENKDNPEGQKKKKKTKPYKEWDEIDRWAVTYVHCPQCQDHIRFRPGQKNFHFAVHAERRLCQECGKMFTKEAFRAHVRVHQATRDGMEFKHECEVCGKRYRFKCSLNSHMRCHSGIRDFDCKICGKKFLSAHGLEKHELVHRKVKPHPCPDCGRGFTQYHNMLAHRRQHTGEKPYQCTLCDRSFTHNVSLKNHKKKEHGVDMWAEEGKPPPPERHRSKSSSSRGAPAAATHTPPQPPAPPPKPSLPSERELMHTLDPAQLYSMMPSLDYGHY